MENEIWREIPGYEGYYEVSDQGRVRSLDRKVGNRLLKGKYLKPGLNNSYKDVNLSLNNKRKTFRVHQLVAMAFLNHKPDGTMKVCVDHLNNIKTDNRLENLQLISNRENTSKDRKGSSKYTGVSRFNLTNKWESSIRINGKKKHLGLFESELEASQYYQDALKSIEEGTEIKVKRPKSTSKYTGVSWSKQMNKWKSYIKVKGKTKHLGYFKCETAAYLAYQAKLSQLSVEN